MSDEQKQQNAAVAKTAKKLFWLNRIKRLFPCLVWIPNYKLQDLRYDIIAGFTVGLTLVPQCMAYVQIADVSPQFGLYSSFLAQIIYALMGTSKDASIGPSSITSMVMVGMNAADPMHYSQNNYGILMSFFGGIILILVGIFRLGFIVNLFSIPVVAGFTTASGFSIMASQLKSFFGIKKRDDDVSPGAFIKQIANVFERADQIRINDVAFGLATICFLLTVQYTPMIIQMLIERKNAKRQGGVKTLTPQQATFMEYLKLGCAGRNVVAFICTTSAAYSLCLVDADFESKTTLVGYIKPGLPELALPPFQVYNDTASPPELVKSTSQIFADLGVWFFIIPMMQMMEMGAITKSLGRKNGYRVDSTNELIAIGLGNLLQSFLQSVPSTAAVTRCALNDQCRVKTQLASLISASIVMIAVGALTEVFYFIPKAALAGIIITAAYNLIDFRVVQAMYREYWPDLIIFFVTFTLCLFYDIAYGILIMLLVNMLTFLRPVVRTQMSITHEIHQVVDEDGNTYNQMTVVKLSHGLKYPSADKFLDRMARIMARGDKHIVLDCQFITGIDYTGLQAVRGILLIAYRQNKHIIFTNLAEHIVKEVEKIGLDHWKYVDSVDDAVERYNKDEAISSPQQQQAIVDVPLVEERSRDISSASERNNVPTVTVTHATSIRRVVSITRPQGHGTLFSATHHQAHSPSGAATPSFSRQNSSRKPSSSYDEEAADGDAEHSDATILRNLTRGAFFYQDIPFSVGSAVDLSAEDLDDDDGVYDRGIEMVVQNQVPSANHQLLEQSTVGATPKFARPAYIRSVSLTPSHSIHAQRPIRFARISEKRDEEEVNNDDKDEDNKAKSNSLTDDKPRVSGLLEAPRRSTSDAGQLPRQSTDRQDF